MNENRGQYTSTPLGNIKKWPIQSAQPQKRAAAEMPGQRGGRRFFALSLIVCVVLPLLFLAALIVQEPMLRWAFLGVTAVCVILMWALRAFAKSARNTCDLRRHGGGGGAGAVYEQPGPGNALCIRPRQAGRGGGFYQ